MIWRQEHCFKSLKFLSATYCYYQWNFGRRHGRLCLLQKYWLRKIIDSTKRKHVMKYKWNIMSNSISFHLIFCILIGVLNWCEFEWWSANNVEPLSLIALLVHGPQTSLVKTRLIANINSKSIYVLVILTIKLECKLKCCWNKPKTCQGAIFNYNHSAHLNKPAHRQNFLTTLLFG